MKNNLLSTLALVCSVLALIISIVTCIFVLDSSSAVPSQAPDVTSTFEADETYTSLLVPDWSVSENTLNISSFHVDLHMPEGISCQTAELVVYQRDEILDRMKLELLPGEASGVLTLDSAYTGISLPELAADDEFSLWLEVSLSDGSSIQHCGAQWYMEDGQLLLVAG